MATERRIGTSVSELLVESMLLGDCVRLGQALRSIKKSLDQNTLGAILSLAEPDSDVPRVETPKELKH